MLEIVNKKIGMLKLKPIKHSQIEKPLFNIRHCNLNMKQGLTINPNQNPKSLLPHPRIIFQKKKYYP